MWRMHGKQGGGKIASLTPTDLDFVISVATPDAQDKEQLKRFILEDDDFRSAIVGDDRVFQQVMTDDEIFLKISPALYFEVLLRRAFKELKAATYTVERAGRQNIPVFDAPQVVEFLARPDMLDYLAEMLASFIRVNSYVMPVRVRPGIRRRVVYSDLDIDSLIRLCAAVDEEHRLTFYKRIADACLFVLGVFPESTFYAFRQPSSTPVPTFSLRKLTRTREEYEEEGRRFYGLAERHPQARDLRLSQAFGYLHEHFVPATKPLNFIASHYLHSHHHHLFGSLTQQGSPETT